MGAQSSTVTISKTNESQRPMKAEVNAQKPAILDQVEGKEWEELEGKKVAELQHAFNSFHDKLTEKESVDVPEGLVMFVTALTSEGSDSMSGIPKLVDGVKGMSSVIICVSVPLVYSSVIFCDVYSMCMTIFT